MNNICVTVTPILVAHYYMATLDGGIQLSSIIKRDDSEEGLVSVYSSLEERQTTNNAKELNKEYKVAILVQLSCMFSYCIMHAESCSPSEGRQRQREI